MKYHKDNNYLTKDKKIHDIHADDFLEMNYAGLPDQIIAKELDIDTLYVQQIKNEIQRNY